MVGRSDQRRGLQKLDVVKPSSDTTRFDDGLDGIVRMDGARYTRSLVSQVRSALSVGKADGRRGSNKNRHAGDVSNKDSNKRLESVSKKKVVVGLCSDAIRYLLLPALMTIVPSSFSLLVPSRLR